MISGGTNHPCFPNNGSQLGPQVYGTGSTGNIIGVSPELDQTLCSLLQGNRSSSVNYGATTTDHIDDHHHQDSYYLSSLLDSLSVIKDKVHQVQSLLNLLMSPSPSTCTSHTPHDHQQQQEQHRGEQQPNIRQQRSALGSNMGTLIQDIVFTASSMMFSCQQMSLISTTGGPINGRTTASTENTAPGDILINGGGGSSSGGPWGTAAATNITSAATTSSAAAAATGDHRGPPFLSFFGDHPNFLWNNHHHIHHNSSSYNNGNNNGNIDNYPNNMVPGDNYSCSKFVTIMNNSTAAGTGTAAAAKQNTDQNLQQRPAPRMRRRRPAAAADHESLQLIMSDQQNKDHVLLASSSSSAPLINNNNNCGGAGYDIVEVDAEDLLAKYTHFCRVCGKGFKRDANLRMHMRAHGDEYKSNAALSNPLKKTKGGLISNYNQSSAANNSTTAAAPASASAPAPAPVGGGGVGDDHHNSYNDVLHAHNSSNMMSTDDQAAAVLEYSAAAAAPRKVYSCPHEGCRWNQKHPKFQPLKSMICVKNHYKRSHCPKMYVCKRCNRKQFSVLSDLKTHEKHCGDLRWQCSCGTTFSRKDKLMGHVALFIGHTPMIPPPSTLARLPQQQQQQRKIT